MKAINALLIGAILTLFFRCTTESDDTRNHIAVLKDESAGVEAKVADAVAEALKREGFEVTFLSAEDVCKPGVLSAEKYFLYTIPNSASYPNEGEEALSNYLKLKGNLLVLGTPVLPGQPLIETVSPGYKMYPMHDIASLKVLDNQEIIPAENLNLPVPITASSCYRRPTGKGIERGYSYRWIPLISAYDKDGLERGTAAWMLVKQKPFEKDSIFKDALRRLIRNNKAPESAAKEGSVFAVCAITDSEALMELARTPLFGNMAKSISKGMYLSYAGAQEFSYWPKEQMQFGAAIVNYGINKKKVIANITVTDNASHKVVFKKKKKFAVNPGETLKKIFGEIQATSESEGYQVTTELVSDGEKIDVISYEVGVLSAKEEGPESFVTVKGKDFWLEGKKWYPIGANYWPRSAIGTEQEDYLYHWLTPGYYDPEQVDDDLQRLQDMGASFIGIRANYKENKRTILDFLRRCRNHNIYVHLFLQQHEVTAEPHYFQGILMPWHFEKEKVAEFINETHISGNPALLSWDLAWEPAGWVFAERVRGFGWNGNPNFRQTFDKDWANWIDERYGNLESAETDWGVPVPRTEDDQITSPSDKQLREDGKWRIMVAAYRRFQADLMNRKFNDACSYIRQLDPNHLISYRQGNLPPYDFTLISTHKQVDFFSMEAYSFKPEENGENKVGFVNRYMTYALGDKPFMWIEYGFGGVRGKFAQELDYNEEWIKYQEEYVEMVNLQAYKNGANGIAPWWFAGGFRNDEKTDFGITTAEGTLRPSGESVKKYGEMYRTALPERPTPNTWLTIDLDANSGGLWYLTNNKGADAYEKASKAGMCLGLKTSGTGTTSVNTPLLAVGDTKYNWKNPPKYLNGEFNWFKIKIGDGEWLEITNNAQVKVPGNKPVSAIASVGNLQEASWVTPENSQGNPGGVYLSTTDNSELKFEKAILKDTYRFQDADFGGDFLLTEGISTKTNVEIQMLAKGRAWFGEKLRFTLVPTEE